MGLNGGALMQPSEASQLCPPWSLEDAEGPLGNTGWIPRPPCLVLLPPSLLLHLLYYFLPHSFIPADFLIFFLLTPPLIPLPVPPPPCSGQGGAGQSGAGRVLALTLTRPPSLRFSSKSLN